MGLLIYLQLIRGEHYLAKPLKKNYWYFLVKSNVEATVLAACRPDLGPATMSARPWRAGFEPTKSLYHLAWFLEQQQVAEWHQATGELAFLLEGDPPPIQQ